MIYFNSGTLYEAAALLLNIEMLSRHSGVLGLYVNELGRAGVDRASAVPIWSIIAVVVAMKFICHRGHSSLDRKATPVA